MGLCLALRIEHPWYVSQEAIVENIFEMFFFLCLWFWEMLVKIFFLWNEKKFFGDNQGWRHVTLNTCSLIFHFSAAKLLILRPQLIEWIIINFKSSTNNWRNRRSIPVLRILLFYFCELFALILIVRKLSLSLKASTWPRQLIEHIFI